VYLADGPLMLMALTKQEFSKDSKLGVYALCHAVTSERDLVPQVAPIFQWQWTCLPSHLSHVNLASHLHDVLALLAKKKTYLYQEGIDKHNKENALSQAQKLEKWALIPTTFTVAGGELGPTLKLKGGPTADKYRTIINSMYAESP